LLVFWMSRPYVPARDNWVMPSRRKSGIQRWCSRSNRWRRHHRIGAPPRCGSRPL